MQQLTAALVQAIDIMSVNAFCLFFLGALGALIRDITDDDGLQLPTLTQGKFYLGFVGGMIIGGVAGMISGDSLLGALTAGFAGYSVIVSALGGKAQTESKKEEKIQDLIARIARKHKIDEKLALAVAEAESGFNATITHKNADGSTDRGLYQINDKWHPEVSEQQAMNPEYATEFFCKAVKNGNLSWWNASKTKWIDKVYAAKI